MKTGFRFVVSVVAGALLAAVGDAREFEPVESSPRPTVEAYRLLFHSVERPSGLEVVGVQPGSPVLEMESSNQADLRGVMELGDVVSAVDSRPIRSFADYFTAMDASAANGGRVELTVIDRNTRQPRRWLVQARKVQVPAGAGPPSRKRKAHFLLIGLTNDLDIGAAMQDTLALWQHPIENIEPDRKGNVRVIQGAECQAGPILRAVEDLQVAARDTVFCLYCGHGAFDPARATPDDPSRGHHFQIRPSGDLMRKTLSDALAAKGARLTVLISDTCNIEDRARPAVEMLEEERTVMVMGLAPFERLLFNYRGVVDISGTDFGQYGFCQSGYGSWVSASGLPVLERHSDWQSACDQLRLVVDADFQTKRAKYGIAQPHLTPVAFRLEVIRDEPVSPMTIRDPPQPKEVSYRVRVPVAP
ncbi:MAG: hypothetical protein KDA44_02550 [Planctomycetales bacterium]|nr:hypothetical protein [Planctomycetales bacterium]